MKEKNFYMDLLKLKKEEIEFLGNLINNMFYVYYFVIYKEVVIGILFFEI